jgi:hypothetical protein
MIAARRLSEFELIAEQTFATRAAAAETKTGAAAIPIRTLKQWRETNEH